MPVDVSTVTMQTATNPPSTVVARTTDVPSDKAVIVPLSETAQTDGLELVHFIALLVASSGKIVATS